MLEVGASLSPTSSLLNTYAAAGFGTYTILFGYNDSGAFRYNETSLEAIFEKCRALGIKAMIRLRSDLLQEDFNVFTDEPSISGINFADYQDVLRGFQLADEPSFGELAIIKDVYVPWFNEKYSGSNLEFFVNLISAYSTVTGRTLRDENGEQVKTGVMLVDGVAVYYRNDDGLTNGQFAYKTDENYDYLYENGSKIKVTVTFTEEQKETHMKGYYKAWLDILDSVNSANKIFSHDAYPLHDNQAGKINLVNPNATDEEKAAAETIEDNYLAVAKYFTEEDLLTELDKDTYEYYVIDGYLSRSLQIAQIAKENGYKYGAFIQVYDQGGTKLATSTARLPTTLAEVRWQVYLNLALGAKQLNYFGYDQNAYGSYMTLKGNPLPLYYLVQQTNAELNSVDHVFASFETWVGIKTFTPAGAAISDEFQKVADKVLDSLTNVSSVTTDRDLIVGEMIDGNGNHGYMLVGYDDPLKGNSTQVSMTFDGAYGFIVYSSGVRTLVKATNGVFSTTLAAGDGVFVIPLYAEDSE